MNAKIEIHAGCHFSGAGKIAQKKAIEENTAVEFDFNQVLCVVDKDTNLDWLYRDYNNAHLMD